MTTAKMLASIEAQIRNDIPRLMELREGCLVRKDNEVFRVEENPKGDGYYVGRYFYPYEESIAERYEIIGHDIMINDVLEWLSKIDKPYRACFIDELGFISRLNFDMTMEVNGVKWNLQSPYLNIDQSRELIEFLYELIKE